MHTLHVGLRLRALYKPLHGALSNVMTKYHCTCPAACYPTCQYTCFPWHICMHAHAMCAIYPHTLAPHHATFSIAMHHNSSQSKARWEPTIAMLCCPLEAPYASWHAGHQPMSCLDVHYTHKIIQFALHAPRLHPLQAQSHFALAWCKTNHVLAKTEGLKA